MVVIGLTVVRSQFSGECSDYHTDCGAGGDITATADRLEGPDDSRPNGGFERDTPTLGQIDATSSVATWAAPGRPAGRGGSSDGSSQPIATAERFASGHARSARASFFEVSPNLLASRLTWVSTTIPVAMPNAVPRTTFAVLRPTPPVRSVHPGRGGSRHRDGRRPDWPSPAGCEPWPKKAGRTDQGFELTGAGAREAGGIGKPAEQFGGDHVDPSIRALGGEDGRHQKLVGIGVRQRRRWPRDKHASARANPPGVGLVSGRPAARLETSSCPSRFLNWHRDRMQARNPSKPVRLAGVSNKTTMSQVAGGLTTEMAVIYPRVGRWISTQNCLVLRLDAGCN